MSTIQINRSPDLARLVNEGFEVEIIHGTSDHLLVHNIPYLNSEGKVLRGTLECPLEINPEGKAVTPVGSSHQCWFIGDKPHHADGTAMDEMIANQETDRGDDVKANFGFSRTPADHSKWPDHYVKLTAYVALLWHQARAIDSTCDPRNGWPPVVVNKSDVFYFADTATTRCGAGAAASRIQLDRMAIIGLGGTGAYILDSVAKTHSREIHLYDGDIFESHSAFRAPGAAGLADLTGQKKVDYYAGIYGRMRRGIVSHPEYVTAENINSLAGFQFAFVAIDNPDARGPIFEGLRRLGIPFVDAGMGVTALADGRLRGQIRTTLVTPDKWDHVENRVSFAKGPVNDVYTSDIQVAELNALNAAFAVIRWKKLFGSYLDERHEHHSVYRIGSHALSKEDCV